jgi:hypothetical protein
MFVFLAAGGGLAQSGGVCAAAHSVLFGVTSVRKRQRRGFIATT